MDGRQPFTIAAVVVHYQRLDLLEGCLIALGRSTPPIDHVVVVENGATDPDATRAMLDRLERGHALPRVVYLPNPDNRGYAAACNQGWRAVEAHAYLFLNPDVTVAPETVERCAATLRTDPRAGVVTARLVRPDGTTDHACHRGLPTPGASLAYSLGLHRRFPRSRRMARYVLSWEDLSTDHDVEACSGAFLLARTELLHALGGWDEGYWFYAEDLDLCLRAMRRGWRVRYLGTTTAVHQKSATSHVGRPDADLTADELLTKRRIRRAVVDAHERFFRVHLAQQTPWPVRHAVFLRFRVERRLASQALAAAEGRTSG